MNEKAAAARSFAEACVDELGVIERAAILAHEGFEIEEIEYPQGWEWDELDKEELAQLITEICFERAPRNPSYRLKGCYAVFGDTEDGNAFWNAYEGVLERYYGGAAMWITMTLTRVKRKCIVIEGNEPYGFFYCVVPIWVQKYWDEIMQVYVNKMCWNKKGYERLMKSCMADAYGVV